MILFAPEEVKLGNINAELLGVFMAIVDQELSAIDDVLGDPVVDLAMELKSHHVLGVTLGGAVDLS